MLEPTSSDPKRDEIALLLELSRHVSGPRRSRSSRHSVLNNSDIQIATIYIYIYIYISGLDSPTSVAVVTLSRRVPTTGCQLGLKNSLMSAVTSAAVDDDSK